MRTTLNLEDEAFEAIKKYAEERDISMGKAASDLVTCGAQNLPQFKTKNGWVIFDVPEGAPALTLEALEAYEQAEIEDEHQRAISPRR